MFDSGEERIHQLRSCLSQVPESLSNESSYKLFSRTSKKMRRGQLMATWMVLCFISAIVCFPVVFSADNAVGSQEVGKVGKCKKSDIVISQANTKPLPSGIPTFRVEITNQCSGECPIWNIHFNCGWFSSASLIRPNVFKRLSFNDCLVNGGQPLPSGHTLSFYYATTYLFPLSVSSFDC